jgi:hypothetical protein
VLARVLESAGLSTVQLSMLREHTEKLKPPRALWVPFPFGAPVGRPNDPELQHRVLAAALALFERPSGPVLEEFPDDGGMVLTTNPVNRTTATLRERDVAFEVASMRAYYDQFVQAHGGRTSVGLARLPATRFRALVRLLEAYLAGQPAEPPVPLDGVSLPQYLRWACDDLKALYVEARLVQQPTASGPEIMRWFWDETLAGDLVSQVRLRMEASPDPADKAFAYGIARG